jgi:hypothetical protein
MHYYTLFVRFAQEGDEKFFLPTPKFPVSLKPKGSSRVVVWLFRPFSKQAPDGKRVQNPPAGRFKPRSAALFLAAVPNKT